MASTIYAALLVFLLMQTSKGFGELAEDKELEDLLASLESDSITKREENNAEFPEDLIDHVDHMKEELEISGLEDFQNTVATDDDSTPIEASFEPVGCFRDHGGSTRPLPVLLGNLRSQINWHDLNKTIRACALLAKTKGFNYFGIKYYGECWSGPTADQTYNKDGPSDRCIVGVGRDWANYVYRFKRDECSNYTRLDSSDRSLNNNGANGIYTCDDGLTLGWYRFTGQAGTRMATTCPQKFHCGAHAPGWMKGTLPRVAEGAVNRKACFNWRNDCCYWDSNILVRNCGGYYVYRLQKPPFCRLKYCGSSTSVKKRTFISDIPDTTTIGLPESAKEMTDADSEYQDMSPRERESTSSRSLDGGTEMDMFLGNGNDEVVDEYSQVGCYHDRGGDNRPLPILLANLRPQIDWRNLNKTVRACAGIAQSKGYRYFGIQFYGECWSGPNAGQTYDKDGASSDGCVRGVGKAGYNFVYRFPEEEKTTISPKPTPTALPLPAECTKYTELDSAQRSERYGPNGIYTCDDGLSKGWYRFTGQAGTRMATTCPQKLHCGAHAPGWMKGTLPRVAEGAVNRKACFNWRNDCCYWDSNILVRNCGGYYVYRLQKPPHCRLKYCASGKAEPPATAEPITTEASTTARPTTAEPSTARRSTTKPSTAGPPTTEVATTKPEGDECTNYDQLDSANRSENHGPNGVFECDKTLTPGWYRFTGPAGTQMATKCPKILHCGTHAPGWMSGALPSVAEEVVKRKVCFSWKNDCCHFETSVLVRNCGGFFVYKLSKPPMCRLRYCGSNPALPTTGVVTTNKPRTTRPTTTPPPPPPTTMPPTMPPMPIRTFRLCEHRSGVLRCPPGQKIKIRYANYGRTEGASVCPHRSIRTTKCYSPSAANLVRCACNGHNSCSLYAKNQVYGDPCVGTFKYIDVKYQCVLQILEDIAMR